MNKKNIVVTQERDEAFQRINILEDEISSQKQLIQSGKTQIKLTKLQFTSQVYFIQLIFFHSFF